MGGSSGRALFGVRGERVAAVAEQVGAVRSPDDRVYVRRARSLEPVAHHVAGNISEPSRGVEGRRQGATKS
jgi:hypothetical protein